jgi:6-phosphogluconolactonase (cycloisomerase 2 family)
MKIGSWAWLMLAAAPLLAGCGDFWQAPSGGSGGNSIALTNNGDIAIAPAAASGNTVTITVTPSSSFTGTVALSCALTSSPSGATSPATCSMSPTSLDFTADSALTSTLTATTTGTTSNGAYDFTVTGSSSGISNATTSVCVEVTTSSTTCGSAAATSGVFYVLNQVTNQMVAFTATSTGTVNTIGTVTMPVAAVAGVEPASIAIAPNGNFLFASTEGGVFLYTIGTGGSLALANGGLAITQYPATTMQVDSTNSWLVFGISGSTQLYAASISSSTGQLASPTLIPFTLPGSPLQLVLSPGDSSSCNNCYVFVAMGNAGTEAIHFNPSDTTSPFGTYGNIALINVNGGANTVAVDPTNGLLYIGETAAVAGTQTGGLRAFTIASTQLPEITGSPYASGGTGPSSILPSADGNYVYIANQAVSGSSDDNISSFSVSPTALTSITTVTAGPAGRIIMAEDSSDTYLFAVDYAGDPDLTAYTMSSGTLTSLLTSSTGTDPVGAYAIAALP